MAGFNKGALGSPWSRETYSNEPLDIGDAEYGEDGPRIASGVLGKRVTMDVQRNSGRGKDRGGKGGSSDD
jgi:hypothetical protein